MAAADADCNVTFVDIGCQGRISDGGVFKNAELCKKIEKDTLNLKEREKEVPYVFLADAAFSLNNHIMKPYPGYHPKHSQERIFNF